MKSKNAKSKINKYIPSEIEPKWKKQWEKESLYDYKFDPAKKKYYTLVELPYPSGDLHTGHWFAFVTPDILSRYKSMKGFSVFFPMGYDAFGLPAENAAIKRHIHPKDWTMQNITSMTRQFQLMGTMIDWNRVTITCLPEYYKWNQWIFIEMFKRGIAYRSKTLSNWCPVDQTVLANEHVENGKCWRCGAEVEQKEVEQWFLKITEYADRLLWTEKNNQRHSGEEQRDDSRISTEGDAGQASMTNRRQARMTDDLDWPKSVQSAQNDWIGKSEGMLIDFDNIKIFTTRPETTDGATFVILAPEHAMVAKLTTEEQKKKVEVYVADAKKKNELERKENKEKTGVFTGSYVINPVTGKKIPIWIADYVLVGYGTGAIMAVPFADERDKEFATKFDLPIMETTFTAKPKGEKFTNYHLHDWSVSRQRYWGTPVPMVHCPNCGIVPVPEIDLPVTLPYDVDYTPKGKPPLASNEGWLAVKCPKCGKEAKRDAETMDTFFDSSWYYYRYVDPSFKEGLFDKKLVAKLMPIDIYFGGGEHTLGHTLYARFFTKFFHDLGLVDFDEFALKRVQHGIVLGPDGNKMSKSKGNVVSPDDLVKEFGADAVRIYLAFMMPYEATGPWSTGAMYGMFRFLKRVWELQEKVATGQSAQRQSRHSGEEQRDDSRISPEGDAGQASMTKQDLFQMHQTIKKVGNDIESIKMNTAIARLMEWLNYLSKKSITGSTGTTGIKGGTAVTIDEYKTFLLLLAPFAPHMTEELFQLFGNSKFEIRNSKFESIHLQNWPVYDEKYLVSDEVTIVVQINGKVRYTISIQQLATSNQEQVEKIAKESEKVRKYLDGKAIKKVVYIEGRLINFVI